MPKLQEQQAELLERNRLLEQLREDLSARLAKQQDALNDLRAAGDKLVALAGATASECAAAQQTSHDAQLAALEHISQVCVTARIDCTVHDGIFRCSFSDVVVVLLRLRLP